jgi:hypothetical protein
MKRNSTDELLDDLDGLFRKAGQHLKRGFASVESGLESVLQFLVDADIEKRDQEIREAIDRVRRTKESSES